MASRFQTEKDGESLRFADVNLEAVHFPALVFRPEASDYALRFSITSSSHAGRLGLEDGGDFLVAGGHAELAEDFAVGEHFRDGGEGPQMEVVVLSRDDEEDDEMDRGVIECLEVDADFRPAEDGDHVIEMVRERVGNRDAGANTGADLLFASFESSEHFIVLGSRKLAGGDEMLDQLRDRRPVLRRLHVEEDLVGGEQLG